MTLALFKRSPGSRPATATSCDCGNVPASFHRAVRPRRPRRPRLARVDWRGVVLPIVAIAIWWTVSEAHLIKSGLLVSPAQVLATAWQQIISGALLKALCASLAREASGFVIGTLGGLLLGSALGFSRLAARMIGPSFDTFKQV